MATSRSRQSVRSKASASRSGKSGGAKRPAPKAAKAARPKASKLKSRAKTALKARAAQPAKKLATAAARSVALKAAAVKAAAVKAAAVKAAAVKAATAKAAAVKAATAKAAAAKAVAGKPTIGAKPGTAARIVAGARIASPAKPAGRSGKPARVTPPAVVRPLGVLPPEARVKVVEKPPLAPTRPKPAKVSAAQKSATQGVQRVSEKDTKFFEERLLAERVRILKDMGHIENTVLKVNQRDSSGDLSGYSFHMADAGTDAMEREKAFMFASSEGRMLIEVDDALRRLYRGEYGICEICGNPIARARLEAMPYVRLCVPCKEQEEKANRAKGTLPGTSAP